MNNLTDEIKIGVSRVVALQLWELGAVKINLTEPFKLTSGNYSPIYINCRRLISSVAFADLFAAAARLICETQKADFDVVAGGETAGIPFAAFVARAFGKPLIYIRKAAKGHGLSSLVEGSFAAKSRVLLVEDLITDAGSKLHFISAIKEASGLVDNVLVVFDRLQGGRDALAAHNIRLLSVTDMETVLQVAESSGHVAASDLASVKQYLESPSAWHASKGLPYAS